MLPMEIDFLDSYSEEAIIDELNRIASSLSQNTLTKADIERYGRVSYATVNKRFGSLRKALEAAGLRPQRYTKPTDEELLAALVELWQTTLEKEGRAPQRKDVATYGAPFSGDTYYRRFGSWKKALLAAYKSLDVLDDCEKDDELRSTADKPGKIVGPRKAISLRKRFFVMKRDGFTCVLCGACGQGVRLEVDHKVPHAMGGTDALDNLQTLCFECNRGKRASTVP